MTDDLIQPDEYTHDDVMLAHSGFVVVVGRPNVGKSTLLNHILGEKIAIVSPKPQTTRLRQLGILTRPDLQVIFVDTPGIHQPQHKLGQFMVSVARDALQDADVILFVADMSRMPNAEDQRVAALITEAREGEESMPVILALNKIDLAKPDQIVAHSEAYRALVPDADWTTISATLGDGVDDLLARLIEKLPPGPQFYPEDQISDMALRDIVAETVREKVLLNLAQEVPHSVAVDVEEFTERNDSLTYIRVTVYVERDSQKAILIGKGGSMLKRIGSAARPEIEALLGKRVYLEPWVKVLKNWRRDEVLLRRLGYKIRR